MCVVSILIWIMYDNTSHQGIKSDLVGFSDDVSLSYLKNVSPNKVVGVGKNIPPYEMGREDRYKKMRNAIFAMKPTGANTSLIFSKDVARKRVSYVRRKFLTRDPNAKIYMIIMTDGLENSSLRAAKNHHMGHCCNNIKSYQRVVKRRTRRGSFFLK